MATMSELKKKYVAYFEDVPIQRYAAMAIGRDEDTIIRWRKEDSKFAEAIQRGRAKWIRKRVLATKAEFALERLEHEIFAPKVNIQNEDSRYEETYEKLRAFMDDTDDGAYDKDIVAKTA